MRDVSVIFLISKRTSTSYIPKPLGSDVAGLVLVIWLHDTWSFCLSWHALLSLKVPPCLRPFLSSSKHALRILCCMLSFLFSYPPTNLSSLFLIYSYLSFHYHSESTSLGLCIPSGLKTCISSSITLDICILHVLISFKIQIVISCSYHDQYSFILLF